MPKLHIVRQGEYLSGIAQQYKFARWQTIYEHPDNADFRRRRPDPNVIYPGDRLRIPDKEKRFENGATDQQHVFRVARYKVLLRLKLRDGDQQPLAGEPYVLTVDDREYVGSADGDGLLEQEIRAGEQRARLHLKGQDLVLPLRIGHLDPVEDDDIEIVTGAQARLNNLGFFCGPVDNTYGPKTAAAVRAFQREVMGQSDASGELGAATRRALLDEHGC